MSPAWVLAGAWAALGLAGVGLARPRRHTPLTRTVDSGPPARRGPLSRLGGALSRRFAPDAAPDPAVDRGIGLAAVAGVIALVVAPAVAPVPILAGALLPRLARTRADRAARAAWADALPDAVDLIALGLGSGLAVAPTLGLVAPHVPAPVGAALAGADERIRHGAPLAEALGPVAAAAPEARPLVSLLVAAACDGSPVVEALARLATDLRADRRRAVEARARQVPVRMLFPLVLCTLPAFVLLTIVPPVVAALSDLQV